MINKISILVFAAVITVLFSSCKDDRQAPEIKESYIQEVAEENEVIQTLRTQPELSDFSKAIEETIETSIRSETFTYTIFAPNNEAFSINRNEIKEDNDIFTELLEYHIIGERIRLEDLRSEVQNKEEPTRLVALNGKELLVTIEGDKIALQDEMGNTAYILSTIDATNGVVYIIDNTLIPEQSLEE